MIVGGVVAALLGAVLLALGAQFQNRGVRREEGGPHGLAGLVALARTPAWLLGTGFLTLAILLQLVGLLLAPLPVVQPLGVLSLVVTALLSRRVSGARIRRRGALGIAITVAGTTAFVITASFATRTTAATPSLVAPVLVVAGVLLILLLIGYGTLRRRAPAIAFALAGGACFGLVATLMKVVLDRCSTAVQHGGLFDATTPFTLLVGAGAAACGIAGISLVQRAYASGSADLVVAALTVIDPLVAVTVGIALLDQAHGAPPWSFAVLGAAEIVAIAGVVLMARNPPAQDDDASDDG